MSENSMVKKIFVVILPAIIAVFLVYYFIIPKLNDYKDKSNQISITNFEECVAAGNPVMESYPRQCRYGEKTYTENIEQIVGGDKDEHGCIGSAGYSWCEPKEKCLRIWEEQCYSGAEQEIQYYLANKYDKPVSEVVIDITKQTEDHVAGGVAFGTESLAGGMFLAVRLSNMWDVVYDGHGSIDCDKMRIEYNFPDEILKPNFCD